jgi:PAS domain S-box-containing protein
MAPVSERSLLQRLNEAHRALCQAADAGDLSALFQIVVEQATILLGASRCELYLRDESGVSCCATSYEGSSSRLNAPLGYGDRIARAVVSSGETVLVDRYDLWGGRSSGREAHAFKTALGLPIKKQDDVYAVLCILSSASSSFSSIDVESLRLFAAQVVGAIRLVEAEERCITERIESKAIIDQLPTGVILVDPEMHVVSLNRAAEEMCGYASREAAGRHLSELFGPEVWGEGSALHQAIRTGGRIEPTLVTMVSKGVETDEGVRRILLGAAPLNDGYLLSLHRAGPFYQMKADRVSDLSHDVRAPLAAIRAYTELLMDEADEDDPEMRRLCLETIDQRAGHLTDLIVNLTNLVRLELGHFEPNRRQISLRDVAEEVIDAFQVPAQRQQVPLILDSPKHLSPVWADRDMMDALFKILIGNAIKFSMSDGEVIVSLRSDGIDQTITVADQGLGIGPQELAHVFDVFHRGRAAIEEGVEGIGVGLTLAKAIVEAHNGHIEVESDREKGSRFLVTLPCQG